MQKIVFVTLILFSLLANASSFEGDKKVYLVSSAEELTQIGDITFTSEKGKVNYKFTLLDTPFENQFLSMRPFQCLMGKKQVMCHVPYPYEADKSVDENDLSLLSNDLLFLHKNPSQYGINMWNGIYYKLNKVGDTIEGKVFEVDMNEIASPPDDTNMPFDDDQIFEADVTNYVYPKILIK